MKDKENIFSNFYDQGGIQIWDQIRDQVRWHVYVHLTQIKNEGLDYLGNEIRNNIRL